MGLILPQTVSIRTNGSNCKHFREKGYTFKKCGDFIEVDVLDLPKGSGAKVKIICDICGKETEMCYGDVVKCNKKNKLITCASNSCTNKKYEDTCMKKYGCVCSLQSEEAKKKTKETCMKKYGVDHPSKAKEIKDKKKKTFQNHFGCDNPMQNTTIRNKAKATNIERYGSENPFGSKEIQDKIKKTLKEKYGENIVNVSQVKEIQDKIKATNIERYGVDHPNKSSIIQNKIKATNLERYGFECPLQSEEVKKKTKETCIKKYGVDYPMQNTAIRNKAKVTNIERYGVENVAQSEIIQNRMKATCKERYGVEHGLQSEIIQNKMKATCKERYGYEHPLQSEEIKNKALDSFRFNGTGPCSRAQKYIYYILNGILNKRICGLLVDIYMEKENIIIEYDGGGHFLGDKMNGNISPTKESLLREKEREDKIINNGYKMIRFIATKDRIPSDEVILNLVEGFKNSDFKVIRINFEEGTIDRDYKEKWYCNFGKLRRITKKDLEQFESKKQ